MIYLVAGLGVISLIVGLFGVRTLLIASARGRVLERLDTLRPGQEEATAPAASGLVHPPLPPLLRVLAFTGWALPHVVGSENLQWDLIQAGYRRPEARLLLAGSKVVLTIALGASALALASAREIVGSTLLLIAALSAAIGFFLPNAWVTLRRSQRRTEILQTLPDALDLMVICVEAGQGLNAALLNVGREIRRHAPALSDELQLINHEIRVGLSRAHALRNFAARTGVEEARALAAVLIQSDRLGTSIAKALRVHAQSLRTRRRQRAEEAARKTAVKLVFPLIFFIFPELLVVILAPAVIQLLRVLISAGAR